MVGILRIFTDFLQMLGPAPKWASFLDSLTEELEENLDIEIYDDYKFVTSNELEQLGRPCCCYKLLTVFKCSTLCAKSNALIFTLSGLTSLIGSNLLRAYMHGYFMDMRLYQKTKAIAQPFAYDDYRKKKINEKIEESRSNRVQIKVL